MSDCAPSSLEPHRGGSPPPPPDAAAADTPIDGSFPLESGPSQEQEPESVPAPLCSVLTTVVDYIMTDPSPLEPWEFQQLPQTEPEHGAANAGSKSGPIQQVPVLRIFGPILRRDGDGGDAGAVPPPRQSACLYVHGAFPYLLARPVVAGPDGGTGAGGGLGRRWHTDWDSEREVWALLPLLQASLEAALQASLGGHRQSGADDSGRVVPSAIRFVRRLSVVTGRGFYTYCPGPAAPFLRVEYYDPSQRWRIKLALEQGLPDVPDRFHPDPRQYDYRDHGDHGSRDIDEESSDDDDGDSQGGATEPLVFNCYEAHIPYTMQFFKDYNLAGMSYAHLEQAIFRRELPLKPAPSRSYPMAHHMVQPLQHGDSEEDIDDEERNRHFFLRSNTTQVWLKPEEQISGRTAINGRASPILQRKNEPDEVVVSVGAIAMTQENLPDLHQATPPDQPEMATPVNSQLQLQQLPSMSQEASLGNHSMCNTRLDLSNSSDFPGGPWSRCQTSCQVELDTTVAHILNVHDLLTEKQEPPTGDDRKQQQVCWRAVPSLQTVWNQERRRMRRLLQPKDDFLSQTAPLYHAQLDEEPNTPLLTLTETLTGRSGARLAREGMERLVRITGGLHESHRKAAEDILRRHSLHISRVDALMTLRRQNRDRLCRSQSSVDSYAGQPAGMTPTDEDALQALCHLGANNTGTEMRLSLDQTNEDDDSTSPLSQNSIPSTNKTPHMHLSQASMSYSQRSNRSECVIGSYELPLSQPYTQITQRSGNRRTRLDWEAERELTQRIDRGDGILDGLDDYINPETLRPFDDLDDEENFEITNDEDNQVDSDMDGAIPAETSHEKISAPEIELNTQSFPVFVGNISSWNHKLGDRDDNSKESTGLPEDFIDRGFTEIALENRDDEAVEIPNNFDENDPKVIKSDCALGKVSNRRAGSLMVPNAVIDASLLPPCRRTVVAWLKRRQTCDSSSSHKRPRLANQIDQRFANEIEFSESRPVFSSSGLPVRTQTQTQAEGNEAQSNQQALQGMGNQGGRLHIEAGGELKARTRPSQGSSSNVKGELPCPVSLMVVEIHVQCRKGADASSRALALTPQSDRDRVSAIVYVLGIDPGGGEALRVVERGCMLVPPTGERDSANDESDILFLTRMKNNIIKSMPSETMGKSSPLSVECLATERQLILRFASLVRWKDPDFICSWDTQGSGLGYLIERSANIKGDDATCDNPHDIDLAKLLGRTPTVSVVLEKSNPDMIRFGNQLEGNDDEALKKEKWKGSGMGTEWDERVGAGAAASSVVGRLVFASWKLVAEEVKHPNASYLQAVVFAVTGRRIPFHDNLKLTSWYGENKGKERWRVLHYRLVQAMSTIILFDALDVVGRAGEAARLSGVELSQSFPGIRGSQYKVEGVLLRALQSLSSEDRGAKRGYRPSSSEERTSLSDGSASRTQSPWKGRRSTAPGNEVSSGSSQSALRLERRRYFFYSPSLRAADRQEALQVQALTLEPKSGHYEDPVVVCDFTALYPSLMIAYNLCYSTIGGHLEYQSTRDEMGIEGRTTGKIGPFVCPEGRSATILKHHMKSLIDDGVDRCYIAPTGDIYVSEDLVKGVLPQVLEEILTTRAMLKRAANLYKSNVKDLPPAILRQLEARQLALKYVANVTYGYTSATFSGRCAMPRLADTIVECGRRTLTNAINLANSWGQNASGPWSGCSVLYGDTDSIFVRLPGRTLPEAFEFGKEFCKAVTKSNPPPIELKLEKVYLGSIMQTKKKYCGMKYESVDEKRPHLECKGIETIRRDQCALTQKILSNALKTLFRKGIGALKEYLIRQWRLIESGRLPVSDYILTGRVRSQYRATLPVQAALARRLAEYDPGYVVRHKERLAYVIVAAPGKTSRLSDSVLTPLELMEHWDLYTLNTTYYITKHVNAALQRCLSLDPHNIDVHEWYRLSPKARKRIHFWPTTGKASMISSFFGSDICWFCSRKSKVSGRSHVSICTSCRSSETRSVELASRYMNQIQKESQALAQTCSRCNLCFENSGTFAAVVETAPSHTGTLLGGRPSKVKVQSPLANCTCTDCPVFHRRHRAREEELELRAVFQALGID